MTDQGRSLATTTFRLVGFLFLVELTSGIIQGYYVPLATEISASLGVSTADYNWTEAVQLLVSALAVPILSKLGDMFGHKRMLLISTAVTALASWGMAAAGHDFTWYLVAFAFQGFYSVWLPLEVALIFDRGRRSGTAASQTRRAAGFLVLALEAGAILGALAGSRVLAAFSGEVPLTLMIPAVVVTLVFFAILVGVPESTPTASKQIDGGGFALLGLSLVLLTGGLTYIRLQGLGSPAAWGLIAVGVIVVFGFGWFELRRTHPAIDLRMLAKPTMWPVQLTAGLFGIPVLGAQIPLSTFVAADPNAVGYGMGLDPDTRSYVIGGYLVSLIVGAVLFPFVSKWLTPRIALIIAAFLVAIGYLMFLPLHDTLVEVIVNMVIAGIGSGALVAALPAAAAAAAPAGQSGIASGLTNTTKVIGGAIASAVFGLVLHVGLDESTAQGAGLGSYLIVWSICGGAALLSALLLFVVPKLAFADAEVDEGARAGAESEGPVSLRRDTSADGH